MVREKKWVLIKPSLKYWGLIEIEIRQETTNLQVDSACSFPIGMSEPYLYDLEAHSELDIVLRTTARIWAGYSFFSVLPHPTTVAVDPAVG
uniref:Uncharacterized protein n=1 Tax=Megaselia scalaris TaxID=36166 RepID=T1GDM1_MEGSC